MQQLPGCKTQLIDHSWENRVAQRPDTTVVGRRIEGKLKSKNNTYDSQFHIM